MNNAPTHTSRSSQRYEIAPENWISVSIRRLIDSKQKNAGESSNQDSFETVDGKIVDISATGFKLRSERSFSFHEQLIIEVPRPG